jgi:hypothetical protein
MERNIPGKVSKYMLCANSPYFLDNPHSINHVNYR